MSPEVERIDRLADRVHKLVKLRERREKIEKSALRSLIFHPTVEPWAQPHI